MNDVSSEVAQIEHELMPRSRCAVRTRDAKIRKIFKYLPATMDARAIYIVSKAIAVLESLVIVVLRRASKVQAADSPNAERKQRLAAIYGMSS